MYSKVVVAVLLSRRRVNLAVIFDIYMPPLLIPDRFIQLDGTFGTFG